MEHLLKESKLLANREGTRGDHIHQALLDLSSRWLKACDEVEKQKKAVRIVPNWYQFRSNMDDIDAWLKRMEQDKGLAVEVRTGSTLVPRLHSSAAFCILLCYLKIAFKNTLGDLNKSDVNEPVSHFSYTFLRIVFILTSKIASINDNFKKLFFRKKTQIQKHTIKHFAVVCFGSAVVSEHTVCLSISDIAASVPITLVSDGKKRSLSVLC